MDNKDLFSDDIKSLFNENEKSDSPLEFAGDAQIKEQTEDFWKILIVDDEKDIHAITEIVLNNYEYLDKKIKILNAYSAKEASEIMKHNSDIAIVLLDVVMESTDAGLKLVKTIREEINRQFVRIILRTGQPGYAPQAEVITKYDINDYQTKTELSHERFLTVITAGLRAYDSIMTIESYRKDLDRKVEARTNELLAANELLSAKNEQIKLQKDELVKLNASKDILFSIIAHDLKSPFNSILGLSDLLITQIQDFSQEDILYMVKQIQQSSQKAYKLLENLLEWAMLQIGKFTFNPADYKLKDIVNEIVGITSGISISKNINLIHNISDDITIYADKNMANTILRNLITNAIKYSHNDGTVIISAKHITGGVEVSVTDNGVGISPKVIAKLFNINEKTSTPGTADEPGTGLGLILCKEFITKHCGEIWVESEINKGSTFKFTLPLFN